MMIMLLDLRTRVSFLSRAILFWRRQIERCERGFVLIFWLPSWDLLKVFCHLAWVDAKWIRQLEENTTCCSSLAFLTSSYGASKPLSSRISRGGLDSKEMYNLVSNIRKRTLSTLSKNRDRINMHAGITR